MRSDNQYGRASFTIFLLWTEILDKEKARKLGNGGGWGSRGSSEPPAPLPKKVRSKITRQRSVHKEGFRDLEENDFQFITYKCEFSENNNQFSWHLSRNPHILIFTSLDQRHSVNDFVISALELNNFAKARALGSSKEKRFIPISCQRVFIRSNKQMFEL